MATLVHEVKLRTSGFPGAPGWTTFYFDGEDPTQLANQFRWVREYVDAVKELFPPTWSAVVQTEGRLLQTATGLLDTTTVVPADGTSDPVFGTNLSGGFGPGPTGMCVGLSTAGVNRSRKVRGRTYLVPVSPNVYESDGTLNPSVVAGFRTTLQALFVDARKPGVWSRPRLSTGGAFFPVTTVRITDKAAVLTSRRD